MDAFCKSNYRHAIAFKCDHIFLLTQWYWDHSRADQVCPCLATKDQMDSRLPASNLPGIWCLLVSKTHHTTGNIR